MDTSSHNQPSELRHVIVITRHGARFPLKPFPGTISWPRSEKFWKEFGGRLSPVGQIQHFRLGQMLRSQYVKRERLVREDDPLLPLRIHAFTSATHRTLDSVQSLLLGLFPTLPQRFTLEEDEPPPIRSSQEIDDLKAFGYHVAAFGEGQEEEDLSIKTSITIHLYSLGKGVEPVLHGFKNNPTFDKLKKTAKEKSPKIADMAKEVVGPRRTSMPIDTQAPAPSAILTSNGESSQRSDDIALSTLDMVADVLRRESIDVETDWEVQPQPELSNPPPSPPRTDTPNQDISPQGSPQFPSSCLAASPPPSPKSSSLRKDLTKSLAEVNLSDPRRSLNVPNRKGSSFLPSSPFWGDSPTLNTPINSARTSRELKPVAEDEEQAEETGEVPLGTKGECEGDSVFGALLDKLWHITHFTSIQPEKDLASRIGHLQSISQQIAIERSFGMPLFANPLGLTLTNRDIANVQRAAACICRLRYCGLNDADQRTMARLAVGMLPFVIYDIMKKLVTSNSQTQSKRNLNEVESRMSIFSAHDNTIMALLSHLGFQNWPIPEFAAHVIFELRRDLHGNHFVRMAFNADPKVISSLSSLKYVKLPSDGAFVDWADAQRGECSWAEFEKIILQDRQSFQRVQQWKKEGAVKDDQGDFNSGLFVHRAKRPSFYRKASQFMKSFRSLTKSSSKKKKPNGKDPAPQTGFDDD
eukprot:c8997_g1_i1.p1 GENE.c8997_g1_i1~~c8997_g1_i1.p1  ORF type:complete len:696 (+),score=159.73 c8997_g1_i1:40-2127(+)